MIMKEVTIQKLDDVSQKDCALLVQRASRYDSEILIEFGTKKINAKSLMGVLSLKLKKGTKFIIIARGDDEESALNDLEFLIQRNFVL